MERLDCKCLYCGKVTGFTLVPARTATVCQHCSYNAERDEAREVAAGMQPWVISDSPYCRLAHYRERGKQL